MAIFFVGPRVFLAHPLNCSGRIDKGEVLGVSIYAPAPPVANKMHIVLATVI